MRIAKQNRFKNLGELHFMLPSADQLFKDADLIFQQDLAPAHTAKSTTIWLNDHGQQTHQTRTA